MREYKGEGKMKSGKGHKFGREKRWSKKATKVEYLLAHKSIYYFIIPTNFIHF